MIRVQHQPDNFEQSEFPVFPVIFQQQMGGQFQQVQILQPNNEQKPIPKIPDEIIFELQVLITIKHETKYSHLFNNHSQSAINSVIQFLKIYTPFNRKFVNQLKSQIDSLKLFRCDNYKIYVGSVSQQLCHGKGIVIYKNGIIYEGQLSYNKRQGRGVYVEGNVGWYQGGFHNDLKQGEGVQVYYNKSAYKGTFVKGLRSQKGTYLTADKLIYTGSWKLGIIHGKGVLKTQDSIYNGQFVNWLKHGDGQEIFKNGDVYQGEYQNGRFDGHGNYNWEQTSANYEGSFKNGVRHGKGKWSNHQTKFSGKYAEGLKQGYGEMYFLSGNFYKGNFVEDKREGYGQMFWTNGSFYKGQWKNGIQNGKGQIYIDGNDIISGLFENNILVQIIPSIYEKKIDILNKNTEQLFRKTLKHKRVEISDRKKVVSEDKNPYYKKKLSKIDQTVKQRRYQPSLHSKMYFKSPIQNGKECKCIRRLQNFRLKQNLKTKLAESMIRVNSHNQH